MVEYDLGGLNVMVRFEADTYVDDGGPTTIFDPDRTVSDDGSGCDTTLSSKLESLDLTPAKKPDKKPANVLSVVELGTFNFPYEVFQLEGHGLPC
jgi:hypothetical protein